MGRSAVVDELACEAKRVIAQLLWPNVNQTFQKVIYLLRLGCKLYDMLAKSTEIRAFWHFSARRVIPSLRIVV